jgi:hypothetical protein
MITSKAAAFMARGVSAGIRQECPDTSWIFRARNSEGARLSAFSAAFMALRGDGGRLS